jgi:hypothetical protein
LAEKTPQQRAYALISLYEKLYADKYGQKPSVNRHRDKWGFQDMAEDLGYDRAQYIIRYYFDLKYVGHPLQTLLRSYDRFDEIDRDRQKDEANRLRLREMTKKRVEEFEREHGNQ